MWQHPHKSAEGHKRPGLPMKTHQDIDRRSLALARAIAAKIDRDPSRWGVRKARSVCERWAQRDPTPAIGEWQAILGKPWSQVRRLLLDNSEVGRQRRQNSPFCGILSPRERWRVYRRFLNHETTRP